MAITWEDHALVQSSTDSSKQWLIQRNPETNEFRCRCKSYIFSGKGGKTRTCKHIRAVEKDVQMVQPQPPDRHEALWIKSAEILHEVLSAGHLYAPEGAKSRMALKLAQYLEAFVPPAVSAPVAPVTAQIGLRTIIFEDD